MVDIHACTRHRDDLQSFTVKQGHEGSFLVPEQVDYEPLHISMENADGCVLATVTCKYASHPWAESNAELFKPVRW